MRAFLLPVPIVAAFIAATATGCGDGFTPSLHNFTYDGLAPDSSTVLLLSVEFEDPDGNLGGGLLESFLDGRPTGAGDLELAPMFAQTGLPLDAKSGDLQFVLELNLSAAAPEPGSQFKLGVRAIDEEFNASSTVEITLTVDP